MAGRRGAAAVLLLVTVACGSGPSPEEIAAAAEAFGQSGRIRDPGGHWTGVDAGPLVLADTVDLLPGAPVTILDRTAAFPALHDLRMAGARLVQRSSVDLDLVSELVRDGSTWSVSRASGGTVRLVRLGAPVEDGGPVGDRSAPRPVVEDRTASVTLGEPRSFVASADAIAFLDGGSLTVVRAGAEALHVASEPFAAPRLCAIGDVLGTLGVTAASDPSGSSCDELWLHRDGVWTLALGGDQHAIVGVGFADGLVLAITRDAGCVARPCPLVATVHGPDGAIVRELGALPIEDRDRTVVGSVAGVPIAFGGDGRWDGAMFDADEGVWQPIRPYPLAQEGLVEPVEIVLADTHLVTATWNAIGLWAPSGEGSSWLMADRYRYPLWVATEADCLNLRAQPSLDAPVRRCVDRGAQFFADGAHVLEDGIRWVSVLLPVTGLRGWVADQYLSGVSPDDPSEYACG